MPTPTEDTQKPPQAPTNPRPNWLSALQIGGKTLQTLGIVAFFVCGLLLSCDLVERVATEATLSQVLWGCLLVPIAIAAGLAGAVGVAVLVTFIGLGLAELVDRLPRKF